MSLVLSSLPGLALCLTSVKDLLCLLKALLRKLYSYIYTASGQKPIFLEAQRKAPRF